MTGRNLPRLPKLAKLPQCVPKLPQCIPKLPQCVPKLPQLPQCVPLLPQSPQCLPKLPQLPQCLPKYTQSQSEHDYVYWFLGKQWNRWLDSAQPNVLRPRHLTGHKLPSLPKLPQIPQP